MKNERRLYYELPEHLQRVILAVYDNPRPSNPLHLARAYTGPVVNKLVARGYLSEAYYKGSTAIIVSPLTLLEMEGKAPWCDREDQKLGELWSAGVSMGRAAKILGRSKKAIFSRALELKFERWEERVERFAAGVMAWRMRRLRVQLIEAERRGLDITDYGDGLLHHRALMRRFLHARLLVAEPNTASAEKWTADDLSYLRRLRNAEKSINVMAWALRREVRDVAHRLVLEGRMINAHWTEREDKAILDGMRKGLRASVIAARLRNRSTRDVNFRIRQLLGGRKTKDRWSWAERRNLLDLHLGGYIGEELYARMPSRSDHAVRRQRYSYFSDPRHGLPWSVTDINVATRAVKRGESTQDIARWLGREPQVIEQLCDDLKERRRGKRPKLSKSQISEVARLRNDEGWTFTAIARRFNVSRPTINRSLKLLETEGKAREIIVTDVAAE